MRPIPFLLITACWLNSYSQDATDSLILQLLRQGVEGNKLPPELVNIRDSINYPANVVVVQKTKENELNSDAYVEYGDVHYAIWTSEELFTRDPYWITPGTIQRNGSKISFKFTTTYLSTKSKVCYKGLIEGKILKGKWVVTRCSYRPMTCCYDLKKLVEEGNTP